jgi:hypothetical protein
MTTKKTAVPSAKKTPAGKASALAKPIAKSAVKPPVQSAPKAGKKKSKNEHKVKVVRDSFTMPQNEYQKIAEIKAICLKTKMHVKKSEVLRAGLKLLGELGAVQLKRSLSGLEKIKTGRPKKH